MDTVFRKYSMCPARKKMSIYHVLNVLTGHEFEQVARYGHCNRREWSSRDFSPPSK